LSRLIAAKYTELEELSMSKEITEHATVAQDGKLTITNPDLPPGAYVEVKIRIADECEIPRISTYFGKGSSFSSVAEVDAFLKQERESWRT